MSSGLVWTHDTLTPKLKKTVLTLGAKLDLFLDFESEHVQDYMRTHAPWTDRTSNARNGLFAKAVTGDAHAIVCYHTVPYGIWLEVRHSGRYAIIEPTIQVEGKRIMTALNGLLSRFQ